MGMFAALTEKRSPSCSSIEMKLKPSPDTTPGLHVRAFVAT